MTPIDRALEAVERISATVSLLQMAAEHPHLELEPLVLVRVLSGIEEAAAQAHADLLKILEQHAPRPSRGRDRACAFDDAEVKEEVQGGGDGD